MTDAPPETLKATPLERLHRALGAKMVPFAGYLMPLHYQGGILAEHNHVRAGAAVFDVSHMGQAAIVGADAASQLETLVPGDIAGLKAGRMRYTFLTNDRGGIVDDLMATRRDDRIGLIVNASRKDIVFPHLARGLKGSARIELYPDRALLALQGPASAAALARLAPLADQLPFMAGADMLVADIACFVTRSGYTGEDGFEISCPAEFAEKLAERLFAMPGVKPAGLGARDSLRLEAGLCLYGQDLDETTTPIEANLAWTVGRRRRAEKNFPGAAVILGQLSEEPRRIRVGIRPEGKAPARAGAGLALPDGTPVGAITSGGFGPTVNGPVAMGYVARNSASPGTLLDAIVRDRPLPARVVPLPFVPHRYHSTR
ncbi:MAG: glycine cleavage system aminomethyltransferase GcvT [Rhodospirillales bacterium]|nr:glycine cleavage system aminomethyltransferase GcvT [Rhodospirillales bacterium]MSP79776.1 glycine cleavage system aminomethyltransferase GcvT [Rhodospirillales bacterium]